MPETALVVFTYHSTLKILAARGTKSWVFSPANARPCTYVVCTRNRYYFRGGGRYGPADAPERHGAAFLVGKVTTVEPSPDSPGRYIVRFEEYAFLDPQPVIGPGQQNPIWYVADIGQLGVKPDMLRWRAIADNAWLA